jgi:uncharacterized protein YkwD
VVDRCGVFPRRRALLLAAVALATVPGAARAQDGGVACPGTDDAVTAATTAQARIAVLCLVNRERSARGLATLTPESRLDAAAAGHAGDMVARSYFDHVAPAPAPRGATAGERLNSAGYAWSGWGENLAFGQSTPREVMTDWMRSAGHCHNVLNPAVTQLGIGIVLDTVPMWVQEFGRPRGTTVAGGSDPSSACPAAGLTTSGGQGAGSGDTPGGSESEPAAPGGTIRSAPVTTQLSRSAPRLRGRAKRTGRRVVVKGRATGAAGRAVRVEVRRGRAMRWRTVAPSASGAYAVRLRVPAGKGAPKVVIRLAGTGATPVLRVRAG